MDVLTRSHGEVMLVAPVAGRVHFVAPSTLTGELEIYDEREVVADVNGEPVLAPARGFVVRRLISDHAVAAEGAAILGFRRA